MNNNRMLLQALLPLVLILSFILPAWVSQASLSTADMIYDGSVIHADEDGTDEPCGPCSGVAAQAGQGIYSTAIQSESEWESQPLQVNVQVDLTQEGDGVYSDAILSTIEEFGWRTTVFVTGEFASSYPGVVAGIEDRGHEIGVHGREQGEDISVLSYDEQLQLIQEAFSAVRAAVERPEEVLDFKPQAYAFSADTIDALQEFGARSISGVFSIDDHESFSWCPYVQLLGKVTFPYPVTDTFFAIPISTTEVDAEELPLDDELIHDPQTLLDSLIAGYDQQAETKDPLVIVLRPLNTGADETKLGGLVQFLDYVQSNEGLVKPLSSMTHQTSYIPYIEIISAPESAVAGETITVTTQFTSAIWCPRYYFKIYGKYPGEAHWTLHGEHYHGTSTGTFSFSRSFEVPDPAQSAINVRSTVNVLMTDGTVEPMDMEEYLRGVIPNEMPASWHMEALRAQAVAARTYAATANRHAEVGAHVCTTTCCQVWREESHHERTDEAVASTRGTVMMHGGSIARYPVYFSHCIGETRNSEDQWGYYHEYLRRVSCIGELCNTPSEDPAHDGCSHDPEGYFGHGVGMCQHGAQAMARQDHNYVDILKHYYTGIEILIGDSPDDIYIVRAVGQGCTSGWGTCWPTADTYENMDEVGIEVEAVSRVLPAQAAELARQVIGASYLWGGKGYDFGSSTFVDVATIHSGYTYYNPRVRSTGFDDGLDCAGLVMWAYDRAYYGDEVVNWARCAGYCDGCDPECPIGYEGAHGQYTYNTEAITREELRPGDLLFFDAYSDSATGGYSTPGQDGHIDHVAMYVGPFQYEGEDYDIVEATPPEIIATTVDDIIARIRGFAGEGAFDDQRGFRRVVHSTVEMAIVGNSPIDLVVIDPDGLVSGEENPEGPFEYQRRDMNGDGGLAVLLITGERKAGTYQIEVVPDQDALPTETYSLEVVADGIVTSLAQNVPIDEIPEEPYVYESQPPTTIQGTVTDYNGQPVPNALVQIIGPSTVTVHTDEGGYYRSVRLEPGSYAIDVAPDPYDNLMSSRVSVSVSTGAVVTRDFVLNAAGSIAGAVVDAEGNPVVGARLYLSGYERPRYASNEDGDYIVPGLTAGSVVLNIYAPDYDPWCVFVDDVYVGTGTSAGVTAVLGETVWMDFTLQTTISGVATEVNCDILPGVTIEIIQDGTPVRTITSDYDGRYTLTGLAPGVYEVVASKDGFRSLTLTNYATEPCFTALDLRGQTGLIPNQLDLFYVLDCIDLWLYPPGEECGLTLFRVLDVIDAWLYPVENG